MLVAKICLDVTAGVPISLSDPRLSGRGWPSLLVVPWSLLSSVGYENILISNKEC